MQYITILFPGNHNTQSKGVGFEINRMPFIAVIGVVVFIVIINDITYLSPLVAT